LCTEAALRAVRRRYPQIYESSERLLIDTATITVARQDFLKAMKGITPAAHRAATTHAVALSPVLRPLLEKELKSVCYAVSRIFGPISPDSENAGNSDDENSDGGGKQTRAAVSESSDEDDSQDERDAVAMRDNSALVVADGVNGQQGRSRGEWSLPDSLSLSSSLRPHPVYRPRILIHGDHESGQSQLAGALLYALEQFPIFALDLAALCSDAVAKVRLCLVFLHFVLKIESAKFCSR
jgi:hypothetical protein